MKSREMQTCIDAGKRQCCSERRFCLLLSSPSGRTATSYAVAADLSEMELKKILIEKKEGNKSIQRSDEQMNLYKALVDAYEFDKIIFGTYGETISLKRRRDDDEDKDEEPSAGPDRGSKRRREEEPVQTTSQMEEPSHPEFDTGAEDQPIIKSSQLPEWFSQPQKPPTPDRDWNKTLVDTLTPELLAGPTYDLMKGSCKSRRVIPFAHFINNDLEYLRGGASSHKYTTSVTKTKAADYGHIKWIEDLVPRTMWIQEPIDYDKHALWGRRIIAVTELKIVEWHSYKHLDWITNKDKKNMLMRIDELHKFSDGTLTDVRTALDDRQNGIRMWYLPQTIWRKSDKDRAAAMIQVIDKRLKTKRIMRSLERFVGGRLEDEEDDEKDDEEEGGDDKHGYDDEESDEETRNEESFDPILQNPENNNDKGNGDEDLGINVGGEEGYVEEEDEDELYKDININQGKGLQMTQEVEDSHVTLTSVNPDGQQQSSSVSSQFVTSMLNPTLDVGMESLFETTSQVDVQTRTSVAPLPMTTPTMTPSTIATITITSQAPIPLTTASSFLNQNLPNFGSLFGFDNRLRTSEANFFKFMQTNQFAGAIFAIPRIVQWYMDQRMNEAVKEQVKVQVSKILPRIEQNVNEQLEVEVLILSSHSSKTSYVVAADLSEMELKNILIKKMKGNKSIHRSDEQRNLYKALVEAYESNKIILDTYGETITLKRRRDNNDDKDEEPSTGLDRGSKRRRDGKEPESASAPMEIATRSIGRSTQRSQSRQASASESAFAEEPVQTTCQIEEPSHLEFDTSFEDQPIMKSSQHPNGFLNNRNHQLWIFYGFTVNRESARDVYSKRRIIAVTEFKIVEWHSYKHLDWITVQGGDDKLYKFKEGDFKRLRIQDIEDMLLLLVQGKLTNLTVEERFAFNVFL
nr:hypothetical protein [Tanacetum cinerariifolium]